MKVNNFSCSINVKVIGNKIIFHLLIFLLLFPLCSGNNNENKSEIYLVIQGKGNLYFINSSFYLEPSEVIINDVSNTSCKRNFVFENDLNNITIKFNDLINSSENMFYGLKNIIEIDLSNLDTSKVTNMASMFEQCSNLEKIIFGKYKYFFS